MTNESMRGIAAGALVRWTGGDVDRWGVVVAVLPDGRSAAVHFDDGETLQFAWPAENLIRVVFEKGQTVKLEATGERGVISGLRSSATASSTSYRSPTEARRRSRKTAFAPPSRLTPSRACGAAIWTAPGR